MRLHSRKAQDGGNASILVLIIMIAIILYVLLLPGPIRDDLLRGNDSSDGGSVTTGIYFLNEQPGTITVIDRDEYSRNLPSVVLKSTTNSQEIKRVNPFYVKSGFLTKKTKTIPFTLENPSLADNVLLSFDVTAHKGILYVTLNGAIVFEGEISGYNAEPILLDKDLLQQSNTLEFYAEGTGLAFWRLNDYSIQNLRIIADLTDLSGQESKVTFLLPSDFYNNADRLLIKFNPNCGAGVGTLTVDLNNVEVFSGIPDCGIINTVEVSPKTGLREDENIISFRIEKGTYLVDLISVNVKTKDSRNPVYYFEIEEDDYEKLMQEDYYANLTLEFVASTDWKEGVINLNGRQLSIDTQDRLWERNVKPYLYQGHNAIRIEPISTMDVLRLTITLESD